MSKIVITPQPPNLGTTLANATKLEGITSGPAQVALMPAGSGEPTADQDLWSAIRTRARWMNYPVFEEFVSQVFKCASDPETKPNPFATRATEVLKDKVGQNSTTGKPAEACYHGAEAYNLLKATAEAFLGLLCSSEGRDKLFPREPDARKNPETFTKLQAAIPEDETEASRNLEIDWAAFKNYLSPSSYPYLQNLRKGVELSQLKAVSPLCDGLRACFCPFELIWSYWHEEGMLVQSLNAICLRFQNKRGPSPRDPLANLRLNPLRPLSTLLWGYIQDEHNRLTVARRAYEYDHEYGLRLMGKAVAGIQTVDSRSKFLEAFHNLLYVASRFYKEADDTTVRADAFPLLNALKELHLILAQGAHNQFGDLPWAARVEMLIQKWLLARPEVREFLGGAPMIPYKESWMAHADSMKNLQGWTDVTVSHFRDLGVYGEQILLSVRHADWINIDNPANAYNWAVYWRPEIQSYIHSYRAVTGVDMSSELTDTRSAAARNVQPAIHQMRRLNQQRADGNGSPGVRSGNGRVYSR